MSKVLVIAPHPDDEVLGCGGAIQYHGSIDDEVYVHIVANRVINHLENDEYIQKTMEQADKASMILKVNKIYFSNLRDEQLDKKIIDVIVPIEDVISKVLPDIVYIPNETDTDQDHRAVANACKVACRGIKKVLVYEVFGPTKNFQPNVYLDIENFISKKIEAMYCYEGEMHSYPHPRSAEAIDVLAKYRGIEVGLNAAEAYILNKQIIEKEL